MMIDTSTAAADPPVPAGGRPRDRRIDAAVLQATRDLLEEVGYLQLTIGAVSYTHLTLPTIYSV